MAQLITLDLFSEPATRMLQIGNEDQYAALTIGDDWTQIAIAVRVGMRKTGIGVVSGSPRYRVGIASAGTWKQPDIEEAFVYSASFSTTTQYERLAVGGDFVWVPDTGSYGLVRKRGQILNTPGFASDTVKMWLPELDVGVANYPCTHVYIYNKFTNSGSNYLGCGIIKPLQVYTDLARWYRTRAQVLEAMEQGNAAGIAASLVASGVGAYYSEVSRMSSTTYSLLRLSVPFDTVFLSWDRTTPAQIVFADVVVSKLS